MTIDKFGYPKGGWPVMGGVVTDKELLDKLKKVSKKSSPRDEQVGGNHYKEMAIQPGDYIVKNGLGWYEGNAIKYLTRHKAKGQKQDLEKAIHYIQLAIEHYYNEHND